jgi:DNA polymerase I-like protein with 3'-5' exonuclease and polymerase domains
MTKASNTYIWSENDYSRAEPIILSRVANVKSWIKWFNEEIDLYQAIANLVYKLGVDMNDPTEVIKARLKKVVTKTMRDNCKVSTLAIMYDESPFAFSKRAGIDRKAAEDFFKLFDKMFPEIKIYKDSIRAMVDRGEDVTTLFGQRRSSSFPRTGDYQQDKRRQAAVERQLINFPIQSTGAGITLWKSYEFITWLETEKLREHVHLVNIVHDSMWIVMLEELAPLVQQKVRSIMEDMSTLPFPFDIKLKIESKLGYDLSAMMSEDEYWAMKKAGKN